MIVTTRNTARRLRDVFRRTLGATRGFGPPVCISTGPDGMYARATSGSAAVEYHEPGHRPEEQILVPVELLADCEGKKGEPVELWRKGKGITASWRDGEVPQIVQYQAPDKKRFGEFPGLPEEFAQNEPGLLEALHEASQTCDPDSARYALGCLQLRGAKGEIATTDGRQILVQSGFTFPWQDNLLVYRNVVFASKEIQDQPVVVGCWKDYLVLRAGPWTIWLTINRDGRFPDVDPHLARPEDATAKLVLSPADAEFLTKSLPKLPSDDEVNRPLTVDLNGQVMLRGKAAGSSRATELLLCGSRYSGQPVRLSTDRSYLARAVRLRFRELCVFDEKSPVLCCDEHRRYAWALLDPESLIPPAEDALRISSSLEPAANGKPATSNPTKQKRRNQEVPKAPRKRKTAEAESGIPESPAAGQKPEVSSGPQGTIEQAIELRDCLRLAAEKANRLIRALKEDKKQARQLRSALASLRELQALDV